MSQSQIAPLDYSFVQNAAEADLNRLLRDLFSSYLGSNFDDANVLGAMQLGSFDLLRKAVHADGLMLLNEEYIFAASRYLYQAWKAQNQAGRGLQFLRTYLQLLFYGEATVTQMWQEIAGTYPLQLRAIDQQDEWVVPLLQPSFLVDGSWTVSEETYLNPSKGHYLTSRIEISLDIGLAAKANSALLAAIRSTIPARLVPIFKFVIGDSFAINAGIASVRVYRQQLIATRVIGVRSAVRWKLGRSALPYWGLGENESGPLLEIDY